MIKKFSLAISLISSLYIFGQIGINTPTPNATLEVLGKASDPAAADGIIAPRLTGDQLKDKDNAYTTAQTGTLVYVTTAVTSPITGSKTEQVIKAGYYMFDGTKWAYAFGGAIDAGNIPPGGLVFYHKSISAVGTGPLSNFPGVTDLPNIDGVLRIDGNYVANSNVGPNNATFNPRLVNTSSQPIKLWYSARSNVHNFSAGNYLLGVGAAVNMDNTIWNNLGFNRKKGIDAPFQTNSNPRAADGAIEHNEAEMVDLIVNKKWYRIYYFPIVDNLDDNNTANDTREVYISVQRLY